MVFILKRKVSWLRLMAIQVIWTASYDDAARQACGKAAARWEMLKL
jgi:hypothetical protein